MDNKLKREIILKNYEHPKNKGLIVDDTYQCSNTSNESCIDEINLMVKIEDDKIVDIRFDGEACAVCTSSTSIMINTLIGKTIEETKKIKIEPASPKRTAISGLVCFTISTAIVVIIPIAIIFNISIFAYN